MKVSIEGLFGEVQQDNDFTLIGKCFLGEKQLSVGALKHYILTLIEDNDLDKLKDLNGFFSIIYKVNNKIYLISDKVRSRPLFYCLDNSIQVSDNFYTILNSQNFTVNPTSKDEYLHTGYVTSYDTLVDGIYQVEAAQVVELNEHNKAKRYNYWHFIPEKRLNDNRTETDWLVSLDKTMISIIDRLVKLADGRQIVIPLSGGYDSRAIALYLKKSGYTNILAFTFGQPHSHEVKMSKKIADSLGIEWHNIIYSRSKWLSIRDSQQFKKYIDFISSGTSVANIQVFPAIKELLESNTIKPDAIICPGHTADFVAGKHFTSADMSSLYSVERLLTHLKQRHFQNSRKKINRCTELKIHNKVELLAKDLGKDISQRTFLLPVGELWNARERQSKFIVNSNRYYDFFKLDWWMPFWDNEFISLWETVPYSLRLNTYLWETFINTSMLDYVGKSAPLGRSDPEHNFFNRILARVNYFTDPNGLYALVPFKRWMFYRAKLSDKTGTVFGVLSEDYIQNLNRRL